MTPKCICRWIALAALLLMHLNCYPNRAWSQVLPVRDEPDRTPGLSDDERREGWLCLFDGESFFGWRAESDAAWKVEGGAIVAEQGKAGLLRTSSQFDDFRLRLEFCADESTHSGVFIRTSPTPDDPTRDCYRWSIAPADNPFPTGSLVGRAPPQSNADTSSDHEWRQLEIEADGGRIRAWLDDELLTDYEDHRPLGRGYLGLQFNQGRVAFRHIRLKPLNLDTLLQPDSFQGWNRNQLLDTTAEFVGPQEIRIKGGRGQLESTRQFADFVLSLRALTHNAQTNSGVFFRCLPGELMNGYECQINNAVLEGNLERPADGGTGAVFRHQNARRVVSGDNQWFNLTIIACGPHIATWVNSQQVVDWTDRRPANPNPRRGLRLSAGTIILQGHDADDDISFADIRASELSPRNRR